MRGALARAGHGRRDHLHRRHDGLRPPGRLVQGLPGRPLVLHRRRPHRRRLREHAPSAAPRRRASTWAAGRGRPGLQRLRRDRARQLRADQDQRAAEPERADRLRRAPRRPRHPDRPRRPAAPARPGRPAPDQVIATIPVYTNSEDGLYGPAVDNDFAHNHWVYLYYSPLQHGASPYPRHARRPGRRADHAAADPSAWDAWEGYFQLSRFKFVDGDGTPAAAGPRERAEDPEGRQQPRRVLPRRRRHRLRPPQQPVARHRRRHARGRRQLRRLLAVQRHEDQRDADRPRHGATGGTFTLTFDGQTTAPIAYDATAAPVQAALEALGNVEPGDVVVTGGPVNTANVTVNLPTAQSVRAATSSRSAADLAPG